MLQLWVMVGAPGCGKSTWLKRNLPENAICVSRDEIRLSMLHDGEEYFSHEYNVFQEEIRRIIEGFNQERNVYVDATHLNYTSRRKLINSVNANYTGEYEIVFVFFDVCLAVCLERNALRTGRARVPEEALRNMFFHITYPAATEFPNCHKVITILANGEER